MSTNLDNIILYTLTDKSFKKEFPEIRESKMRYFEYKDEENRKLFLESLQAAVIYFPCIWELTEEEENQFKSASIMNILHINSPCIPVIFNDEKRMVLPVFTNEYEVPQIFREKYAIQNSTWSIVKKWRKVLENHINKDIVIAIDMASDACLLISTFETDFLN